MTRSRRYRSQPGKKSEQKYIFRYLRIIAAILLIVTVASFYIYQRVWVRNLDARIKNLESKNEKIWECRARLEARWMAASSIAGVETAIDKFGLDLRPTKPSQNRDLPVSPDRTGGRLAGLVNALEKLKENIPILSPNDAEAEQLFETK